MMFWGKVFFTKEDVVVAICDEDLIEKKIKHDKISKNFYGEMLIDGDVATKLMKKATIGNLMGKEIIKLAKKGGFITKENIILIGGIHHAQFVKL